MCLPKIVGSGRTVCVFFEVVSPQNIPREWWTGDETVGINKGYFGYPTESSSQAIIFSIYTTVEVLLCEIHWEISWENLVFGIIPIWKIVFGIIPIWKIAINPLLLYLIHLNHFFCRSRVKLFVFCGVGVISGPSI